MPDSEHPSRAKTEIFSDLAKGVSTGTRTGSIRVIDCESLLLDCVFKINRGTVKVRNAHLVDYYLYPIKIFDYVAVAQLLIEVKLVDKSRASAWLNSNSKAKIVAAFCANQGANLALSLLCESDSVF
jgi:hypothetical protein